MKELEAEAEKVEILEAENEQLRQMADELEKIKPFLNVSEYRLSTVPTTFLSVSFHSPQYSWYLTGILTLRLLILQSAPVQTLCHEHHASSCYVSITYFHIEPLAHKWQFRRVKVKGPTDPT